MKRKYLEKIEPVKLSQEIRDAVFAIEAQIIDISGSSILELDIYEKNQKSGEVYLLCRHFVSQEKLEYETIWEAEEYHPARIYNAGEWAKMKYETIITEGDYYRIPKEVKWSSDAEKIVKDYYSDTFSCRPDRIIEQIEYHISQERMERATKSKAERIEKLMAQVEPLGMGFDKWIREVVFPQKYIFREPHKTKRGYRCHCSTCGKTYFSQQKLNHNIQSECKKCKVLATVKSRVQQIKEKENILVMQKLQNNRTIIRHFRAERIAEIWNGKVEDFLLKEERIRIIIAKGEKVKIYYPTADRHIKDYEWWDERHSTVTDKNFYMYPEGITDTSIDHCLKNTLLAAAQAGEKMDYNNLIRCWTDQPYLEYLIKGKLYRLANEIIGSYGWWSKEDKLLDLQAKRLVQLLKIDGQRINRLKSINGGRKALLALRSNADISQENLIWINKNDISISELMLDKTQMSLNKALNYTRRQMIINKMKFNALINYYKDYLDMAANRGMDITDDIVRATPRMMEYHNQYLEEKNRAANEQRYQEVNGKYQNIKNNYHLNQEIYGYENDDYTIIVPREAADIVKEGQLQHHCVGAGDSYINDMNKETSLILFLRRQQEPDIPYYTIQANQTGRVLQRYAAYNRDPDAKAIDKFLAEWKKELKKREKNNKKELLTAV
jgi:hypothetical protein